MESLKNLVKIHNELIFSTPASETNASISTVSTESAKANSPGQSDSSLDENTALGYGTGATQAQSARKIEKQMLHACLR